MIAQLCFALHVSKTFIIIDSLSFIQLLSYIINITSGFLTLLLLPGYNISRTCGLLVNFRIIELLLFCFCFTFVFVPFLFRIRMTSLSQRFLLKTLYKNNGHIHTEQFIVQNIRYINETNTNTEIKP
jgi:hypothetical protein